MIERIAIDRLEDVVPLFDAYRVFYKQESDAERARLFLQARMRNQESIIFVAYEQGKAVGFTQLYPSYSSMRTSKNWILNDLYVAEVARKKGIGEKLISRALTFAKEDGATSVRLSTQVENENAQRLYKKMGFVLADPETSFLTFIHADL